MKENEYEEYVTPVLRNMRSLRMRFQRRDAVALPHGISVEKPALALEKLKTSWPN
jgi:hypothetical protein